MRLGLGEELLESPARECLVRLPVFSLVACHVAINATLAMNSSKVLPRGAIKRGRQGEREREREREREGGREREREREREGGREGGRQRERERARERMIYLPRGAMKRGLRCV